MAKTTSKPQLVLGGGELRTRDDGSQYVYDPTQKKGYMLDSAQGQFLLGNDPTKAKSHGGYDKSLGDAFKAAQDPKLTGAERSARNNALKGTTQTHQVKDAQTGVTLISPVNKDVPTATTEATTTVPKPGDAPTSDMVPGPKTDTGTGNVGGTVTGQATDQKPRGVAKDEFITNLGELGQAASDFISTYEKESGKVLSVLNPDVSAKLEEAIRAGAGQTEVNAILSSEVARVPYEQRKIEQLPEDVAKLEQNVIDSETLSPETLSSAQDAYARGYMDDAEYKAYLEKHQPSAADTLVEQTQNPEFKYADTPEISIANSLSLTGSMDFTGMSSMIAALTGGKPASEMTSAELNQIMLAQMQLSASSDYQTKLATLYGNMKDRAMQAYDSAKDDVDLATSEIDNILTGKDSTATTLNSLMVRVAQNSKDTNMMSLQAQEKALNADYEFTFNKMLEQNSRLEGYMKAKLNWMGAADSSAGLTTLAMAVDNAQQTLLLYQGKHEANMIQLEAQKTSIMNDYYNSVTEQLLSLQGEKNGALAAYNDKLDQIEGNELASNQEAQTMQLNVLSGLVTNLHQLDQEQKSWEYQLAQDAYNKAWKEMEWTHDIEKETKAQAASNLDMLAQAYNGMSFDQVDPEAQQSMVEMAKLLGLPESFPREMLNSLIRASAGSGGGGGGGSGSGGSSQYAAYAQYAAQQAASQGMSVSDWLDVNTQFDSNSKDLIQQAYIDSQIEGQMATQENTTNALAQLGLTWDDLAKAGEETKKKQTQHAWSLLTDVVTGASGLINVSPIK